MDRIDRVIKDIDIVGLEVDSKEFLRYKRNLKRFMKVLDSEIREKLIELAEHHENTLKHNMMVAHDVKYIAESMGLSKEDVDELFVAALLHDIGKIDVLDILLDSTSKEQNAIYGLKVQKDPSLKLGKKIPIDIITVEDFINYKADRSEIDKDKILLFLKEKHISTDMLLREYLNLHQERTREILMDLRVNTEVVRLAAGHHPEYFETDLVLDWKCNIISIADKFNAIIQSEGVRKYTSKMDRILALDIIIRGMKKKLTSLILGKKKKEIIRILGRKYIRIELEKFVFPLAKEIVRQRRKLDLNEVKKLILDIEKTFEVNNNVKYVIDDNTLNKLEYYYTKLGEIEKTAA